MISDFDAPIPGQSLTTTPGNMPYERPPEIVDPEEAIQMHLSRLSEKKKMAGVLDALELGIDIKSFTTAYLRSAVANGIHTIDVSLIIAPVIHEFVKKTAQDAGVEFEEGFVDEEKEQSRRRKIEHAKAKRKLEKAGPIVEEAEEEIAPEVVSEELPVDLPDDLGGEAESLMKRRTK